MPTLTRCQFSAAVAQNKGDQSLCFYMSIIWLINMCPGPGRGKPKLFTCYQEAVAVVIYPGFKMGKNRSEGGVVT